MNQCQDCSYHCSELAPRSLTNPLRSIWCINLPICVNHEQAYARIGMAKEAADVASQAKDGEVLGRLKLTFAQNAAASSIFDTLRDRLGVS